MRTLYIQRIKREGSKHILIGIPEEEIRENEKEVIFEEIMTKNFSELKKLSSDSRITMIPKVLNLKSI